MYCDSAYRYTEENRFDAFGNVRIVQNDTLIITGRRLEYSGRNALAVMYEQVVMTDGKMTLRTDALQYNLRSQEAMYRQGAEMTDADNRLYSRLGFYHAPGGMIRFRDSVHLINPRYILTADSLHYHVPSRTAYFTGYTKIESLQSDSARIYCFEGWYQTQTGRCWYGLNTIILSRRQVLYADSLFYDAGRLTAEAFRSIRILDEDNQATITGHYGWYDDKRHYSIVTRQAVLSQKSGTDSLYLHADTLLARWDSSQTYRQWHAYPHCRIFKSDLQAITDSLVYHTADSTFRLYGHPIIWTAGYQLTADSVHILTAYGQIEKMHMFNFAFIAFQIDSLRFDQIRARHMTGFFHDGNLYRIRAEGNGQSVYHVKNKAGNITGVNRADCTDMVIDVKDGSVTGIHLHVTPEGTLFPVAETRPEEFRLKGFSWQIDRRPVNKEDIFNRR
jgi:lipopolysaccharide export system protein LptA